MKEEEIISSGLLELYVTGTISANDKSLVEDALLLYPSVRTEIEAIELAFMKVAEDAGGQVPTGIKEQILHSISHTRTLTKAKKSSRLPSMLGWAAALLCFVGLFWMLKQNNELKESLRYTILQNSQLEDTIQSQSISLEEVNDVLGAIRNADYKSVPLPGHIPVAPQAYATVYFNNTTHTAYVDVLGLPEPPRGKVYQVWSLTLNPLTPSSIGLLSDFKASDSKFFKIENIPTSEAFGITLEPAGGSESPTMDQLYALGTIAP